MTLTYITVYAEENEALEHRVLKIALQEEDKPAAKEQKTQPAAKEQNKRHNQHLRHVKTL